MGLEKRVQDIVKAAAADRKREVNFEGGQFNNLNWTEFLQPVYTTFMSMIRGGKTGCCLEWAKRENLWPENGIG